MHRRATILTSTAVLALLAGCGGTPTADGAGGAAAPSKAPAKAGLADCLVGRWTLDLPSLVATTKSTLGSFHASGGEITTEVTATGSETTTYAKGGTFTIDDNVTLVMGGTRGGGTMEQSWTVAGKQKGTWKVDGTTLIRTVTEDATTSKTVTKLNGKITDEPSEAPEPSATSSTSSSPATCDATALTLSSGKPSADATSDGATPAADATSEGATSSADVPTKMALVYKRA